MEDSLPPKNGGKAKAAGLETSFACCFWQPVSKVIQLSIFDHCTCTGGLTLKVVLESTF